MQIVVGDLIPHRDPLAEYTSFWEVRGVEGEGDSRIVILEPVTHKPAVVAGKPLNSMQVPEKLLHERTVYRKIDQSALKAAQVMLRAVQALSDVDTLGTDPRAWALAFIEKHGQGDFGKLGIDVTTLIGWFARAFDAGRADVKPEKIAKTPPSMRKQSKPKRKRSSGSKQRGVLAKK